MQNKNWIIGSVRRGVIRAWRSDWSGFYFIIPVV